MAEYGSIIKILKINYLFWACAQLILRWSSAPLHTDTQKSACTEKGTLSVVDRELGKNILKPQEMQKSLYSSHYVIKPYEC